MPRSPDLAIFVLINRQSDKWTEPIALPLVHVGGVVIFRTYVLELSCAMYCNLIGAWKFLQGQANVQDP